MDIGFVEQQYRDDIFKLMEVCGIDMEEAYRLYAECNYSFQAAVNAKFNRDFEKHSDYFDKHIDNFEKHPEKIASTFYPIEEHEDQDFKFAQYKQFVVSGKSFKTIYGIQSNSGFFSKLTKGFKFFRGEQVNPFKTSLQSYVQGTVNLGFKDGTLGQLFEKSWQDNFPLLVHLLDFSLDKKAQIARIYSDEFFVEKTLQEQFYNFGVDIKNYVLEEPLRAFFDYERDRNCLVVCRVNFLDQIEVLDRLKLIETLPTIKERIKLAKHKNVQEDLTEAHLTKQYKEELQGNYDYVRPKNFKQKQKIYMDRSIRQQQEQEYIEAIKMQEAKKGQQQSKMTASQGTQRESAAQIHANRSSVRANLRNYQFGLRLRMRLPSGQLIELIVDKEEAVQYLFDYVSSLEKEDIGFENEPVRKFDIVRPFDRLYLMGRKHERLAVVFADSDSENLAVLELS